MSSSSRAFDLLELRPREIELRGRRLVARVDVVERLLRQQLPLVEAARAIEVGLRQLQVGFALADRGLRDLVGRLRLTHLLAQLAVLDARDDLTLPHRVAELDVDVLQPPVGARHDFDRCGADQIADDENLLGDRRALHGRELDGHRRPAGASAAGGSRAASWRVISTVEREHAREAGDGDDYDPDSLGHSFMLAGPHPRSLSRDVCAPRSGRRRC